MVEVDEGYRLHPEAVLQFARAIAAVGDDVALITCDHDHLDAAGARHSPVLRPGPSPDFASAPSPVRAVRRRGARSTPTSR